MLSERMTEAINEQINAEFYSSYLYLSMAAHFEAISLPGFANWMKEQAKEEWSHGMKLFDYLNDRGSRVHLKAITQPPLNFESPAAVFEQVLAHEKEVTARINVLYALSLEDNDYATQAELTWFVKEQVEEEKTAGQIVEDLRRIGDKPHALLMIDRQLGARQ